MNCVSLFTGDTPDWATRRWYFGDNYRDKLRFQLQPC